MAPRLPIDARIAIMGAGCAGLTCAEELRERGYRHVTIFEAQRRAGGKIRSVAYEGAPSTGRGLFEAGTVFFVPSPIWTKLLRRHRVAEAQTYMPCVRIADMESGRTVHPLRFSAGHSLASRARQVPRFLSLLRTQNRADSTRPGVAPHVTADTCAPTRHWFEANGYGFVRDALLPLAGGAQFGPLIDSVPVVYVIRLIAMLSRYSIAQQLRYAMPQLRAGHEAVWTKIAGTHDVRLSSPVTRIEAGDGDVVVETPGGRQTFDALIVAASTDAYQRAATHLGADERDLFAQVRTLDREVITARVSGFGPGVFYAPRYGGDGRVPRAHPYLFYEVDRRSGLYTFHPYLDEGCGPADTEAAIRTLVARLGGRLESIEHRVTVRGWFPHFSEAALRGGAYARLEAAQGRRNVWMAGELLAGVSVPHGMEYAAALVDRMTGVAHA